MKNDENVLHGDHQGKRPDDDRQDSHQVIMGGLRREG